MDLLPGKTLEELAPVVDELRIMLDGVTGQFGAGHWGEVVEVEGQLKDFVGWESVDVSFVSLTARSTDIDVCVGIPGTRTSGVYPRVWCCGRTDCSTRFGVVRTRPFHAVGLGHLS